MKEQILEVLKRLQNIVHRTRDIMYYTRTLGEECDEIEMIIESLESTIARRIDHNMGIKMARRKRNDHNGNAR